MLHAAGECHLLERSDKMPVLFACIFVTNDFDLFGIAAAEALFVS